MKQLANMFMCVRKLLKVMLATIVISVACSPNMLNAQIVDYDWKNGNSPFIYSTVGHMWAASKIVTGYNGVVPSFLEIPYEVYVATFADTFHVVSSVGGFSNCSTLNTLRMTWGGFRDNAFSNCKNLRELQLYSSFSPSTANGYDMPENAFEGCDKLHTLTLFVIPGTSIGTSDMRTFYGPNSARLSFKHTFKQLNFSEGIRMIPEFSSWPALESVSLPKTATNVVFTYSACPKLREIKIGDGNAAYMTDNKIIYPANDMSRVLRCPPMHEWSGRLSSQTTQIVNYAFSQCSQIPKELDLQVFDEEVQDISGLKAIGAYAFYNCPKIESVTVPKTLTSVGSYAFAQCPKLTEVIMEGDAPSGTSVFGNTTDVGYPKDCIVYYYAGTKGWGPTWCGRPTQVITERSIPSPKNVKASDGTYPNHIEVTWDAVPTASYYQVYRRVTKDGEWQLLNDNVTTISYSDLEDIEKGSIYYYYVKTVIATENELQFSGNSKEDQGSTGMEGDAPYIVNATPYDERFGRYENVGPLLTIQNNMFFIQISNYDKTKYQITNVTVISDKRPENVSPPATFLKFDEDKNLNYYVATLGFLPDEYGAHSFSVECKYQDIENNTTNFPPVVFSFSSNVFFPRDEKTKICNKEVCNWFKYWGDKDAVSLLREHNVIYDDTLPYYYDYDKKKIKGAAGAHTRGSISVSSHLSLLETPTEGLAPNRVPYSYQLFGIYALASVIYHEGEHKNIWVENVRNGMNEWQADDRRVYWKKDADGDRLMDEKEEEYNNEFQFSFRKDEPDSYDLARHLSITNYKAYGDQEVYVRWKTKRMWNGAQTVYIQSPNPSDKQLYPSLENEYVHPKQDWAHPGAQSMPQNNLSSPEIPLIKRKSLSTPNLLHSTVISALAAKASGVCNTLPEIVLDNSELERQVAFAGVHEAVPVEGENKFSALRVTLNLIANEAMQCSVLGYLVDSQDKPIAWARTDLTVPVGTSTVELDFNGKVIYSQRSSAGYKLKYAEITPSGIDLPWRIDVVTDIAQTPIIYNYTDFESDIAYVLGNYVDQKTADDIRVSCDLEINEAGAYTVTASLYDGAGENYVATARSEHTLGVGIHRINLDFSGEEVYLSKMNGSYTLHHIHLIKNDEIVDGDEDAYATAAYSYGDFRPANVTLIANATSLKEIVSSMTPDGFLEGIELQFIVTNTQATAVAYRVAGTLYGNGQHIVCSASKDVRLIPGVNTVSLLFAGSEIRESEINGPYRLGNVHLSPLGSDGLREQLPGGYETVDYLADELAMYPFAVTANPIALQGTTEMPVRFSIPLQVYRAGLVKVRGLLFDAENKLIAGGKGEKMLDAPGSGEVTLSFSASDIDDADIASCQLKYIVLTPQSRFEKEMVLDPIEGLKVIFDCQGGMPLKSMTVRRGEAYGELPVPERTGYTFDGWYTKENKGGDQITLETPVTFIFNHTLHAAWTVDTYIVTFDGNEGSSASQNLAQTYGALYVLPSSVPTRSGYAFTGWFTEASGGTPVTAGTMVDKSGDHTVYAQWLPVTYNVTFQGNGGVPAKQSIRQTYYSNYVLPSLPSTRSGYRFLGWFTDSLGDDQVTADTVVTQENSHSLFARWEKIYTLTLKNGTAEAVTFIAGAEVEVTANDAPLNQEFQKWTVSPASTVFAEGFSINDATTRIIMPAANVTMTAVYVKALGSLGIECVPNNGQAVTGVEWSTDKRTWYAADVTQRLTAGAYTVYFRSTDGKWIVPASTKITLNAGSADSPTLVSVNCEFAPAFDGNTLDDASDPNSDQGYWDEQSGQLDWTGLRVGLRAKLGPLPLQANATSVKLKSGKLPAGLKLVTIDGQVYLSGIPTKAGTYPAVLQAMEGKKAGALLNVSWDVQDLPTEYIGTFNGVYTATTNDITRHSTLTLTVAKTGKLTGSVSLGGKKYSFKADAFDAIDYATEAMSVTNAAFICTNPKLTNAVSLTISLSEAGLGVFTVTNLASVMDDYTGQAVRNGWKDKVKHALRITAVDTVNGYYTFSLYPEDDSYGAGYVTLTFDTKGGVKAAGKLADGTAVSGSGVLLVTDTEVSTVIALSPSAYKGGEFYLNVKFLQDAQPRVETVEPVNWVNTVTTTTSNGPFERKPSVAGGWYSQLTSLYSVYDTSYDPENPYKLGLSADAITTAVSVQFNTKGTGVDALSKANNPYNVKLTLTPKTGLFSGSFNETGVKTAYKLYGILTPYLVTDTDDTAGLGFYSIPVVVPKTQRSELFRLTTEAVEE